MDSNHDVYAPGEKLDISSMQGDFSSSNINPYSSHELKEKSTSPRQNKKRRVSTAHIEASTPFSSSPQASFDYDSLVSACADFLNTSVVNDAAKRLADNLLAVLKSPTLMTSTQIKRRIEQMLPPDKNLKHHRGMTISDQDCTRLCSLADRVLRSPNTNTNLSIVDDDDASYRQGDDTTGIKATITDHVEYIRRPVSDSKREMLLPKQLPSFIEYNSQIDGKDSLYDQDVTPYDSEVDDVPILMVL